MGIGAYSGLYVSLKFIHIQNSNVILFRDRIFVDIIRVRIDMGTKFNVSTHNRKKRTQRHREENYEDKAEIKVMQL